MEKFVNMKIKKFVIMKIHRKDGSLENKIVRMYIIRQINNRTIMSSLIKEYDYWLNEVNDIDFDETDDLSNLFQSWYFSKKRPCYI